MKKTNAALELETLYDVDEREAHIAEQALKLKIRTISLAFIFFYSTAGLVFSLEGLAAES